KSSSRTSTLFRKIVSVIVEELQAPTNTHTTQDYEREKEKADENIGKPSPESAHRSHSGRKHNRHPKVSRPMGPNPNITKIKDAELSTCTNEARKDRAELKSSSASRRGNRNGKPATS